MQKCVILSNQEKSTLPLVKSLAENEGMSLILLSDAGFLLNDLDLVDFFDYIEQKGANLYITTEDMVKRDIQSSRNILVIDYEVLVDILVSENIKVFNF